MRAVTATSLGGPEVLRIGEVEDCKPGPGEVTVRVSYAGVNFVDLVMCRGDSKNVPITFPFVPGIEGAGVVDALGPGVEVVEIGDRVAWAPVKKVHTTGSYAERAVIDVRKLIPVPESISLDTAAAIILQGLTVHYLVHDQGKVGPGTTVLVHAAAGGTGRSAVQWLKHVGATVIGAVSTEEKAVVTADAGADHVIVYRDGDFAAQALALTDGVGVDYIIDGVGGQGTFRSNMVALADRGRVCVMGMAGGAHDQISPLELTAKSITVSGGNMTNFLCSRDEVLRKADEVWQGVLDGWLSPLIHSVRPLDDAAGAHRQMQDRATVGKLLLDVHGAAAR